MATSLTSVVTTALRFSSALRRLARAASVARRSLPQISTSNESRLQRGRSEIAILRGQKLRRQRRGAVAREPIDLDAAAGAEVGKLIRTA